jgi:trigger factor
MIPGFESGIIGKKVGEQFTVALRFPKEYHNAQLADEEVEFDINLNAVKQQILPEIDEEFFKSFGVEEGGETAFHEEIKNNMERELKTASRNKIKSKIMDDLLSLIDLSVPDALLKGEIQGLRAQALQKIGNQQEVDPSMLPDDLFQEQANRRVVLGLVLGEVIKDKNLKADPVKVRESVEELASTYESPDEVINWYYGNNEQLASIESAVLEDQVFDLIIGEAVITEKKMTYQEVIKPDQGQAEIEKAEDDV